MSKIQIHLLGNISEENFQKISSSDIDYTIYSSPEEFQKVAHQAEILLIGIEQYQQLIKEAFDFDPIGQVMVFRTEEDELSLDQKYEIYSFPEDASLFQRYILSICETELKDQEQYDYKFKTPFFKRALDITISLFALVALTPLLLVVMVTIKITSKGPVFYSSKRVGRGFKVFNFYKFRSMRVDADQMVNELKGLNQYAKTSLKAEAICDRCAQIGNGIVCQNRLYKDGGQVCSSRYENSQAPEFFKVENDPRITKIGAFIRRTSIDELPQLINILKGDMSIVGNRPLPVYEAEALTKDEAVERFFAPAGLTGLWQVSKRGAKDMSPEERKALDNKYARSVNMWTDLKVIIGTVPALFQKENV